MDREIKNNLTISSPKRIIGFDVVRILACAFVCIVHFNASVSGYQNGAFVYPNSILPNYLLENRVYLGALGVNLFFIISGASLALNVKRGGTVGFYRKRILSIYPQFWIAFAVATTYDLFLYKGMSYQKATNLLISFAGLDGYLSSLSLIPFEFYKVGEWFLGCIILLYMVFPLVNLFLERFPAAACGCFGMLYLFSLYAISCQMPYLGSSWGITICLCEMFFGMAYIRYGLHQREKTVFAAIAVFLVTWVFRNRISVDFLILALSFLILEIVMILSKKIQSDAVKKKLFWASSLTYPIFLVHHFLSDRMVLGFDLANMPRLYVMILFAFFVVGTLLLAVALKKIGDRFGNWIRRNKVVMVSVALLLLLSYGYTVFQVVHYQLV